MYSFNGKYTKYNINIIHLFRSSSLSPASTTQQHNTSATHSTRNNNNNNDQEIVDDETARKNKVKQSFWNRILQNFTDDYYSKSTVVEVKEVGLYNNFISNHFNLVTNFADFSNQEFLDENGKTVELGDIVKSKGIEIEYKFVPVIEGITSIREIEGVETTVKYAVRGRDTLTESTQRNQEPSLIIKMESENLQENSSIAENANNIFLEETLPFEPYEDNSFLVDSKKSVELVNVTDESMNPELNVAVNDFTENSMNEIKVDQLDDSTSDSSSSESQLDETVIYKPTENLVLLTPTKINEIKIEKPNEADKSNNQEDIKHTSRSSTPVLKENNILESVNQKLTDKVKLPLTCIEVRDREAQIAKSVKASGEFRKKESGYKKPSPIVIDEEHLAKVINKINASQSKQPEKVTAFKPVIVKQRSPSETNGFKKPFSQDRIMENRKFDKSHDSQSNLSVPITVTKDKLRNELPTLLTLENVIQTPPTTGQKSLADHNSSNYHKFHPSTVITSTPLANQSKSNEKIFQPLVSCGFLNGVTKIQPHHLQPISQANSVPMKSVPKMNESGQQSVKWRSSQDPSLRPSFPYLGMNEKLTKKPFIQPVPIAKLCTPRSVQSSCTVPTLINKDDKLTIIKHSPNTNEFCPLIASTPLPGFYKERTFQPVSPTNPVDKHGCQSDKNLNEKQSISTISKHAQPNKIQAEKSTNINKQIGTSTNFITLQTFSPFTCPTPMDSARSHQGYTQSNHRALTPPLKATTKPANSKFCPSVYTQPKKITYGLSELTKKATGKFDDTIKRSNQKPKRIKYDIPEEPTNYWKKSEGYNLNKRPNGVLDPADISELDHNNRKSKFASHHDKTQQFSNKNRKNADWKNKRRHPYNKSENVITYYSDGSSTLNKGPMYQNGKCLGSYQQRRNNRNYEYTNFDDIQSVKNVKHKNNYASSDYYSTNDTNHMDLRNELNRKVN